MRYEIKGLEPRLTQIPLDEVELRGLEALGRYCWRNKRNMPVEDEDVWIPRETARKICDVTVLSSLKSKSAIKIRAPSGEKPKVGIHLEMAALCHHLSMLPKASRESFRGKIRLYDVINRMPLYKEQIQASSSSKPLPPDNKEDRNAP